MAKVGVKTMVKILTGRWGANYDGREKEAGGNAEPSRQYEEPVIISDKALSCTSARLDDFYAAYPNDPERAAMEFWQHVAGPHYCGE